jgi:hypothetical protein
MNWVKKIGYYQLTKAKKMSDDWIIIPDHSIQLGQEKLFVVLGIRESEIDFSRPMQYQDLTPLLITSRNNWTGEIIKDYLSDLQQTIGKIKYAVGDYGSDIKRGLKLSEIPHIHDITHRIANIVEKIYKNDFEYQKFTKNMSEMRMKLRQTKSSHIIPPNQRKKSRYLNLSIISDWSIKALRLIESKRIKKEDNSVVKNLQWIKELKEFIEEMSIINEVICQIEKLIKHSGLSESIIKKCNVITNKLTSRKGKFFKEKINEYFNNMKELLPNVKKILCTSDIIESAFGKYKNYLSCNPMACLTNLSLCIASFTCSLTDNEIKTALESVRMKQIKKWTEENIGITLLTKRRCSLLIG